MFHPQKIAAKIQAIEQAKGIRLRENSVSDCIRLYDHFKSMEVMAGKKVVYARNGETPVTFQLTSQEKQWIENEMYMCACSFPYWFFRYFFIKTKEGDITRPQVLIAQMVLLAILAVLDLANLPILLLILKARQLGLSTIIEGVILYIAIFVKGSHCVVASAEEEKSEQMSNMVWIGLEMLPLWMQPVLTREDRKIGPEFGLIHSDILLQHGSMSKGISRGDTPNAAHLCLRGDALIFSQDGNLVPIEKINIGEKVWTHIGNMSTVKAISKIPSRKRKMLQINTWMNCEPLHLTADHKIWTARGWVRAINLIRGKDEIGTAIRPITGEISQLTTSESRDVLGRLKTVTSRSQVITLDKEFGFFCGYYLAEGSAKRQTKDSGGKTCEITLTHHIDESRYAQRAKEAIDKYATSHKTHGREGTKTGVTHIYGTSFASLICKEFGAKDSKRIPDWIFQTNPEFIKGVIIGYLTGDGSKTIQKNNPALFATSVRPRLLYQFRHLLASVGWGWGGITKEKAFRDNRGWNNSESWTLTIAGAAAQRLRKEIGIKCVEDYQERTYTNKYRIDGGWVWCKVKDFHLSFATHVWDIEVDHIDHSFETVIGAVANSEVAYYPDPINTIESSLIRAMHENPRTFLALETTARKKDDWFHRTWLKNRKGELTGYNRFTCLFLPWYVGRDKYPTADWLRNHPIPQHWRVVSDGRNEPWRLIQGRIETGPLKETFKQAADAKLYVATTKMLKDHMPENWEMPPEQMWYWEFNYVEAIEGDDETLKSFLAELAADERSCFQSKKLSVFTQAELDRLEENISADYQCYAMAGDGIDKRFALADFHSHSKRRIDINWQTINGDFLHWKLIPLKEEPQDINLKYYLKIWEHPKPGCDYTIGIDIASGIGQNNTVYFILKKGLAGAPDEEVALLYSPWIPSPETPPFANMLGVYYGQHMSPVPEALMAPEVQKAVGDFISHQLAKLGYSNFYYMERFDIRKSPGHRPNRRGWASVGWSQQMMKEAFEHGIKAGWIQVNSEELLAELDALEAEETDSGKMMYDHASDHTDDAYVAGGIAYFVTHGQETIMERMKADLKPSRKSKKEIAVQEPDKGATLLARQFQREDRAEFPNAAEEGEGDPLKRVY